MATRYYFSKESPRVRVDGPAVGTWGPLGLEAPFGTAHTCFQLSTSKADLGSPELLRLNSNQQGNYDYYTTRWVTPPLEAATLSGTLDVCIQVNARWLDDIDPPTNDSIVRYKLHAYLAVGQSAVVRTTLINNYVDSVDFPGIAATDGIWRSLAAPQAVAGTIVAGDVIVIELGHRIISSPTPAVTYPPTNYTQCFWRALGGNPAHADAVAGDTSTSRVGWVEFSFNLTSQAASAPPSAGTTCATAISITSFPYQHAGVDTTAAPGTLREIFWTFIADETRDMLFWSHGSNYLVDVLVYTGNCGALVFVAGQENNIQWSLHRSLSTCMVAVVAGTQYWVRVRRNSSSGLFPALSGGFLRLGGCKKATTIEEDDIIVPSTQLVKIRAGAFVDIRPVGGALLTGVAVDYTGRPILDFNGPLHTRERLLVGVFGTNLIELFDAPTLNHSTAYPSEIDFISDPLDPVGAPPPVNPSPAQLVVNTAGMLHVGFYGNGYHFVGSSGVTLASFLNTFSSTLGLGQLRLVDATSGDGQAGAPFPAAVTYPTPHEITATWAIALDEANGVLYYTAGGLYVPVGGQRIKRWNMTLNQAMADFAVLTLGAGPNPGLKGLAVLPGGELLVANSPVVQRLNSSGVVIQTYTPSIPNDATTLLDIELTRSGDRFWVMDNRTGRLFRFNISSGVEETTVQAYFAPGSLTQFAVFRHVCECCVATELQVINDALLKIGVSKTVAMLGEQSREALTAEHLFDRVLRETLRQHPWAFATKYARNEDAVAETDPMFLAAGGVNEPINGDWTYAYRYPDDCLFARRIVGSSGRRFDPAPIPFRVGRLWDTPVEAWSATETYAVGALVVRASVLYVCILGHLNFQPPNATYWRVLTDTDAMMVFTNEADAVLEYTAYVACAENFADALFEDALSWRLASKLAPSLAREGDLAEKCWKMYLHTLDTASAVSSREQQQEDHGDANWIHKRD
jgi:hypothetical protein